MEEMRRGLYAHKGAAAHSAAHIDSGGIDDGWGVGIDLGGDDAVVDLGPDAVPFPLRPRPGGGGFGPVDGCGEDADLAVARRDHAPAIAMGRAPRSRGRPIVG